MTGEIEGFYEHYPERRKDDHLPYIAARRAVREAYNILGVDIDDSKAVKEFQQNIAFAGSLRKTMQRGFWVAISTIVTMIVGVWTFMVEGIKSHFRGGPQ